MSPSYQSSTWDIPHGYVRNLLTFNDLTFWLQWGSRDDGKRHRLSHLFNLKVCFDRWRHGRSPIVWPHFSEWCRPLGSNGQREGNKLICLECQDPNDRISRASPTWWTRVSEVYQGMWRWCDSMNIDGTAGCTGTCWCSILMSATSLWSSSCSLLSSSQACLTWLCSLTSWMLSCLTASSSSFSWACSLARRLCSVLRRYHHKDCQTAGAASHASNQDYRTCKPGKKITMPQGNKCTTGYFQISLLSRMSRKSAH